MYRQNPPLLNVPGREQRAGTASASGAGGALLLALSIAVMAGWVARYPIWIHLVPSGTAMVFNTALCYALLGAALLLRRPDTTVRRLRLGLATLVVVIVVPVLSQTVWGFQLGVDRPSLHAWYSDGNPHPGRIAPNTALALLCAAAAVALPPRAGLSFNLKRTLAAVVITIAVLGMVGYTALLDLAYSWYGFPRMALLTGLAAVLLGTSLLAENGTVDETVPPARRDNLSLFFGIAMTILVAVAAVTYGSFKGLGQQTRAVEVTHQINFGIQTLEHQYQRARRRHLDHLSSPTPESRHRFNSTRQEILPLIADLERLTADPKQQALLATMVVLMKEELADMDARIRVSPSGPASVGSTPIAGPEVTEIDRLFKVFAEQENLLLGRRQEASTQAADSTLLVIMLAIGTALLILLYAFVSMKRQSGRQQKLERTLQQRNLELEDLYDNAPCGYHSVDADGVFVRMNETELGWLGYSREEVIGRMRHHDLHTPRSLEHFVATFARFKETGELHDAEFEYVRKDGTTLWVSLSATTIRDERGRYLMSRSVLYDISERRCAEQALQDANNFLDSVVENIPHSIFVKDARELRYVRLNRAAEKLLGCARHELLGKRDFDFLPPEQAQAFVDKDREVLASGSVAIVEAEPLDAPDAVTHMLRTVKLPIMDSGGRPRYLLGISEEISERLRTAEALRKAKREAEDASRAKSSFLAAMSHEIRTPMNGVIGMVDVLRQTDLSIEQREMLDTAGESAGALLEIIDSVLDFSKIEAGRLDLENVPLALSGIVESVCESLAPLAEREGIQLAAFCDPALPEQVYGDPVRLRQVLVNLIGNAIKFTPGSDNGRSGEVLVRLDGEPVSAGRVELRLQVIDNGIGMDPETLARVFEPFTQARASNSRRFGGTGLGLPISRRIVEALGGNLTVSSVPGCGSTFSAGFGLTVVPKQEATARRFDLTNLEVVVAATAPHVVEILCSYLAADGANVTTARPGADALQAARGLADRGLPCVVVAVADAESGDVQGLREQLRTVATPAPVRFVLIAHGRRRTGLLRGPDTVVLESLPIRRLALTRAVAVAAGRASPEVAPQSLRSASSSLLPPTVADAEAAGQLILVAEDNPTNQKVIRHQLSMLGRAAEIVGDGAQALERWRSGRFGLLLTDCHMPVMDGFELTAAIRFGEEGTDVRLPILALSANALAAEAKRSVGAGMDAYLTKPLKLQTLAAALDRWLPRQETSAKAVERSPGTETASTEDALAALSGATAGASAEAAPEAAPEAAAGAPAATGRGGSRYGIVDPEALPRTLGDSDPAVLAEFYGDFLSAGRLAARELATAHALHLARDIEFVAHKLKSSAGMVGAVSLSACCAALEGAATAQNWQEIDQLMTELPIAFKQARRWIVRYRASLAQAALHMAT